MSPKKMLVTLIIKKKLIHILFLSSLGILEAPIYWMLSNQTGSIFGRSHWQLLNIWIVRKEVRKPPEM